MARRLRLFFATDVHGSERCFRKFLNGGAVYGADAVILGGDIAGKAIQAVDELGGGRWRTTFRGHTHDIGDTDELARVERMISDLGYYPWRCEPGALEARVADGSVDAAAARAHERAPGGAGWRWPTSACGRGHPGLLDARQRRPARAGRGARRRPLGRAGRGPGGRARRPRARVVGLLEPDAVGQLPRDDRGGAGARASTSSSRRRPIRSASSSTATSRRTTAGWTRPRWSMRISSCSNRRAR